MFVYLVYHSLSKNYKDDKMKKFTLTLLSVAAIMAHENNTTVQNDTVEMPESSNYVGKTNIRYNLLQGAVGLQNIEGIYSVTPNIAVGANLATGDISISNGYSSLTMGLFRLGARVYYYSDHAYKGNYFSAKASYDAVSVDNSSSSITGGGLTYGAVYGYTYDFGFLNFSSEIGYEFGNYTFNANSSTLELPAGGLVFALNAGVVF